MAFRHPPPWFYWLAFGGPIVVGLLSAFDVWRVGPSDTSILARVGVTVVAAVAPLAGILVFMGLFTFVMIYLGTPRKGNCCNGWRTRRKNWHRDETPWIEGSRLGACAIH
jgi:hypothetical protein